MAPRWSVSRPPQTSAHMVAAGRCRFEFGVHDVLPGPHRGQACRPGPWPPPPEWILKNAARGLPHREDHHLDSCVTHRMQAICVHGQAGVRAGARRVHRRSDRRRDGSSSSSRPDAGIDGLLDIFTHSARRGLGPVRDGISPAPAPSPRRRTVLPFGLVIQREFGLSRASQAAVSDASRRGTLCTESPAAS